MVRAAAAFVVLGVALVLGGCMQTAKYEPPSSKGVTERDKKLLANAKYSKPTISEPYRRHIVTWHRKELPGTIVVDPDARFLYYVLPEGKAIRYGVTVGEEALAWSGVARVGRLAEWPSWVPTADIHQRIAGLPPRMEGGPDNPLGARGIYLFEGNKDTLFRIHGTNQPEYIGSAISSGCIRMTNEDVIDLYERVKIGSPVVVLQAKQGDSPFNPQMVMSNLRT
jgi:lipoprotein-anchoring transpeptidase ErfK/SrfK